ncbi:MAG: YicC/YloC family endoribonuclease [Candidatus Binatia bacterium]
MKSMTGYGEAAAQGRLAKVIVQLRTLNHRNLDIQLRVPRLYLSIEGDMRQKIRQRISRGRVDLFITRLPREGKGRELELDEGLLGQYLMALRRAKKKFRLKGEMDLSLLSRLPDLFEFRESEGIRHSERVLVLRTLESALRSLDRSRGREGLHLKLDIQQQVRHLRGTCAGLGREAKRSRVRVGNSLSLRDGEELKESQMGAEGFGNSVFKGDIHEEVVRLKSHVDGLSRLVRVRDPVGKRFDFLLQEIQRELSTISSKAPHLSVVTLVLAGKEKVEKVREQVQNVE